MNRAEKEKVKNLVHGKLKDASAGIISDYKGINVPNMSKLRKECRDADIELFIVKNSILKRALKDTDFDSLDEFIEGPVSVALSKADPVTLAKTLVDFSKTDNHLKVKAGVTEGRVINLDEIKTVASLPSREVLLSMVASGFQAPYRGFVCALGGIVTKFVRVLSEIQKTKETQK